jgi:3-deoxy-7-phosphoheptulonate synthase
VQLDSACQAARVDLPQGRICEGFDPMNASPPPPNTYAFQGGHGSYTELALREHLGSNGAEFIGLPSYQDVIEQVVARKVQFGVLPVEYSVVGTLQDAYDLVAANEVVPVREMIGRVVHCLLAPKGASLHGLRELLSHPVALAQCEGLLNRMPLVRAVPFSDPGLAAQAVAESNNAQRGAIASSVAAETLGLEILESDVGDLKGAFTRYLVVEAAPRPGTSAHPPAVSKLPRKTLLMVSADPAQRGIVSVLGTFSEEKLAVSKIVARPRPGVPWEDVFFLEIDGDAHQSEVAACLDRVREKCSFLRILGTYERATPLATPSMRPRTKVEAPPAQRDPIPLPPGARNYIKAARPSRPEGTVVKIGNTLLGGKKFVIGAGPCSVENADQIRSVAEHVSQGGASLLRGGVYKPRTNPYSFQGLGLEGLTLLAEAGRSFGMPVVTEVMTPSQVEAVAAVADMLQIGARNMQNFDLLRAVGRTQRPVMLKRGLAATLDELLSAAEYILAEGNQQVVLCERGIRTFETATRNTLDLSAIPVLRERTHLPILVDPSHGVGVRRWIRPLCRAAKAVGAHGILIEVHPDPPRSVSDADQALSFDDFSRIMADLEAMGPDVFEV